jgi:hypothetical protein
MEAVGGDEINHVTDGVAEFGAEEVRGIEAKLHVLNSGWVVAHAEELGEIDFENGAAVIGAAYFDGGCD